MCIALALLPASFERSDATYQPILYTALRVLPFLSLVTKADVNVYSLENIVPQIELWIEEVYC